MKKVSVSVLVVSILLCFLNAAAYAVTWNVSIKDFFFSPQNIPINVGDSVFWTNNGAFTHTATSGTNSTHNTTGVTWDSGFLSTGQSSAPVTFTQPGNYPYFCSLHFFTGTVTVNAAIIPAPVGRTSLFFPAVETPVVGSTNSTSMPIGIGLLATGGNTLTVEIALGPYAVPVDVYAAFAVSTNPLTIVNLGPGLTREPLSLMEVAQILQTGVLPTGVTPWMSNVSAEINATLFSGIPTSRLAPGQYTAYLLVVPNGGNFSAFDLYKTIFTIP